MTCRLSCLVLVGHWLGTLAAPVMAGPLALHPRGEPLPSAHQGPFVTTGNGGILTIDATSALTSHDEGKTWEEPIKINTPWCGCLHSMIETGTGRIVPVAQEVIPAWRQVLDHDAQGHVVSGSLEDLVDAFASGCAVKIAVRGLCAGLAPPAEGEMPHELFVEAGPGYYYTEQRLFMVGSHPIVRVKPAIPMRYQSRGWDFGWLMQRTDGHLVYRRCDPYTFAFEDLASRHAARWFVR